MQTLLGYPIPTLSFCTLIHVMNGKKGRVGSNGHHWSMDPTKAYYLISLFAICNHLLEIWSHNSQILFGINRMRPCYYLLLFSLKINSSKCTESSPHALLFPCAFLLLFFQLLSLKI